MNRIFRQILCLALSLQVLPGAVRAASAEGIGTVALEPPSLPGPGYTSINEVFTSPAGTYRVILCGLKDSQKGPVLSALSARYDPDTPLKLVDSAFPDAEKYDLSEERDYDSGLCWAASASNLLWTSGWAQRETNPRTGRPFASEDDVFAYFCSRFINDGANHLRSAVDWFFMGEFYNLTYSGGADLQYPDCNPADGVRKDFVSAFLTDSADLVRNPEGISMLAGCDWTNENAGIFSASIGTLDQGEISTSSHALTALGVILDPAARDWTARYRAVILADSDNDVLPEPDGPLHPVSLSEMEAAKAAAPNSVTVYPLEYAPDINGVPCWRIMEYSPYPDDEYLLYSVSRLALFDDALYSRYAENGGTMSVADTMDLTLEGLFTTNLPEALPDMFRVDESEVTVTAFGAGDPVNLNFFVANRSHIDPEEDPAAAPPLYTDWTVRRDADGAVVARGRFPCSPLPFHGLEQGYMIRLNEAGGVPEAWEPGTYTAELSLNPDRSFPEAYYGNNVPKTFSFEIR